MINVPKFINGETLYVLESDIPFVLITTNQGGFCKIIHKNDDFVTYANQCYLSDVPNTEILNGDFTIINKTRLTCKEIINTGTKW